MTSARERRRWGLIPETAERLGAGAESKAERSDPSPSARAETVEAGGAPGPFAAALCDEATTASNSEPKQAARPVVVVAVAVAAAVAA
jgi:hypothetical protein